MYTDAFFQLKNWIPDLRLSPGTAHVARKFLTLKKVNLKKYIFTILASDTEKTYKIDQK